MLFSFTTLHFILSLLHVKSLHSPLLTPIAAFLPFSHHSSHRQIPPASHTPLVPHLTLSPAPGAPLSPPWTRGNRSWEHDSCTKRWVLSHQSSILAMAKNLHSREAGAASDGVQCWPWHFLFHMAVIQEAEDPPWGEALTERFYLWMCIA